MDMIKANTNFTAEQLAALSSNDRAEIQKFRRYLKLKKTKRGRAFLATQKYWRDYQGI